jgi:hypothetical protein
VRTSSLDYDLLNTAAWSRLQQNYDSLGRVTYHVEFNDDGSRNELSYDPGNTVGWSTYQQLYNTAGQLVSINQYNDNGTRNASTFDPTNAQTWSRVDQTFDTAARLTYQVIYNDDGSRNELSYDPGNTVGWSTYQQLYNTTGQLVSINQYNDNGTRNASTFDPTNAQTWSRVDQTFDTAARLTNQVNYNDDGTKGIWFWDPANAQSWSEIVQSFNTAAQMANQNVYYDDGSKILYAYDVNNSQSWSSLANVYMPGGQIREENVYSDTAGTLTRTTYDVNNNQGWTRLVQNFINNVERTATSYNDDGGYTNYQYDSSHNLTGWQRYAYQGGGGQNPYIMVAQWPEPNYGNRPVLLDLNGDGHIDLRPLDMTAWATGSSVTFDWNGDGARDGTAWVGPQDGFLAIDLGENGQVGPDGVIDQSKELAFSEWATPEQVAANGGSVSDLDGLRLVFDSNHDNVLDANDDRWSEFRVWRDANQNGITDAGELLGMSEVGIKLINLLQTTEGNQSFADGSAITGTSSYQTADGTSHYLVGDATLMSQPAIPKQNAA